MRRNNYAIEERRSPGESDNHCVVVIEHSINHVLCQPERA